MTAPRQRPVRGRRAARSAALLVPLAAGCGTLRHDAGPLPVRNQHPAQLLAPHLDPVPAAVLPAGEAWVRWDNAYTSYWLSGAGTGSNSGNDFAMDGEIWRTALDLRVGLGHGLELELELPFGYATGGGLDSFVIDWHDTFGFDQGGRDRAPRNDFEVVAAYQGRDVLDVEANQLQPMDLPIALRAQVLGDQRGGVALRALVELPTGDAAAGFGNERVDVAVGAVADVQLGDFMFFANGQYGVVGDSPAARRAGLAFRDVHTLGGGTGWHALSWLSLHLQLQRDSSVLRDLGFPRAADPQWLLWGGFRIACSPTSYLELGIGEDLSTYVAPDFTLWASFASRFGATSSRAP